VLAKTDHKFNPQPLRYSLLIELKIKKNKNKKHFIKSGILKEKLYLFSKKFRLGMSSVRVKFLSSG